MKKRRIDAWLIWSILEECNFNCDYCREHRTVDRADTIADIPVAHVLDTLGATGKQYLVTLSGGEPFLVPNVIELCCALTEEHTIALNSNFTSPQIAQFAKEVNPQHVDIIVASFHVSEIETRGLLDTYITNYHTLHSYGFNMVANIVAHPRLIEKVEHYKSLFLREGIVVAFRPYRGTYNGKTYPFDYTDEEIRTFALLPEELRITNHSGKACNAGFNVMTASQDGTITPCFDLSDEVLGNIYSGFSTQPSIRNCPLPYCSCELFHYNPRLFLRALLQKKNGYFFKALDQITRRHMRLFARSFLPGSRIPHNHRQGECV